MGYFKDRLQPNYEQNLSISGAIVKQHRFKSKYINKDIIYVHNIGALNELDLSVYKSRGSRVHIEGRE